MLFSCLVDADYTASALDNDSAYLSHAENNCFDPRTLLKRLNDYRDGIKRYSNADKTLNIYRDRVFEKCGEMGDGPEGLYTLTAPTGTGKTLALLHFALRHCLRNGKQRIIIVLPFLTLAEQNAEIYENIVSDVLIVHSQSDLPDGGSQNWPASGVRRLSLSHRFDFSKRCFLIVLLTAVNFIISQTASLYSMKRRAFRLI